MSRAFLVTIFAVAACGGTTSAPGADAGPADARPRADAGPMVDAAPFTGVACDVPDNACVDPSSVCCTGAGSDRCAAPEALCSGDRMQCDGSEDCKGNEVCCFIKGHGSMCTQPDMCAAGDQIMCHRVGGPPCPNGLQCCDVNGGPYGVCQSGGC
ncbi:MAG TPA: hypothetical protein VL463_35195 [Kofleriaceae bacterium]|jgi:hypothetical protein|nr:hypothetical protein [Kofleriaceae bacterium]